MKVNCSNINLLLVNVYFPFECSDNIDEYLECIGALTSIIDDATSSHICIVGDFNADIRKRQFGQHVLHLCRDRNLVLADTDILPVDSFTYMSAAHNTTSWLDHVLCTYSMRSLITNINVLYGTVLFDHIPMQIELDVECKSMNNTCNMRIESNAVNWAKATHIEIQQYSEKCDLLAQRLIMSTDLLSCRDAHCKRHALDINNMYNEICGVYNQAAGHTLHSVQGGLMVWTLSCLDGMIT